MKAALALIVIYIAAFIIATQGGSQNPVQASASGANILAASKSVDPEKDSDLRSLLQFVGAKDQLQSVVSESAAQYREKLNDSVKNVSDDSKREQLITAAASSYQKNFDQQRALQQIAAIYDKHFTDDEIKGLLDFYSSPLGQKFAAESPEINKEIQAVQVSATTSAARESLLTLRSQNDDADRPSVSVKHRKTKPQITLQDQMKEISERP